MTNLVLPKSIAYLFEGCKSRLEIREKCFALLSDQPTFHSVRVLLSKIYFSQGYVDFAIRELYILKKYGEFPLVDRILRELGAGGDSSATKKIIADVSI